MFPEFTNPALILKLPVALLVLKTARESTWLGVRNIFFFFTNGLRTCKSHSWKVKLKKSTKSLHPNTYTYIRKKLCVFKPKGYNIVNAPRGKRDGLSRNGFNCWVSWPHFTPLPSPPPSAGASQLASFRGVTYTPFSQRYSNFFLSKNWTPRTCRLTLCRVKFFWQASPLKS